MGKYWFTMVYQMTTDLQQTNCLTFSLEISYLAPTSMCSYDMIEP